MKTPPSPASPALLPPGKRADKSGPRAAIRQGGGQDQFRQALDAGTRSERGARAKPAQNHHAGPETTDRTTRPVSGSDPWRSAQARSASDQTRDTRLPPSGPGHLAAEDTVPAMIDHGHQDEATPHAGVERTEAAPRAADRHLVGDVPRQFVAEREAVRDERVAWNLSQLFPPSAWHGAKTALTMQDRAWPMAAAPAGPAAVPPDFDPLGSTPVLKVFSAPVPALLVADLPPSEDGALQWPGSEFAETPMIRPRELPEFPSWASGASSAATASPDAAELETSVWIDGTVPVEADDTADTLASPAILPARTAPAVGSSDPAAVPEADSPLVEAPRLEAPRPDEPPAQWPARFALRDLPRDDAPVAIPAWSSPASGLRAEVASERVVMPRPLLTPDRPVRPDDALPRAADGPAPTLMPPVAEPGSTERPVASNGQAAAEPVRVPGLDGVPQATATAPTTPARTPMVATDAPQPARAGAELAADLPRPADNRGARRAEPVTRFERLDRIATSRSDPAPSRGTEPMSDQAAIRPLPERAPSRGTEPVSAQAANRPLPERSAAADAQRPAPATPGVPGPAPKVPDMPRVAGNEASPPSRPEPVATRWFATSQQRDLQARAEQPAPRAPLTRLVETGPVERQPIAPARPVALTPDQRATTAPPATDPMQTRLPEPPLRAAPDMPAAEAPDKNEPERRAAPAGNPDDARPRARMTADRTATTTPDTSTREAPLAAPNREAPREVRAAEPRPLGAAQAPRPVDASTFPSRPLSAPAATVAPDGPIARPSLTTATVAAPPSADDRLDPREPVRFQAAPAPTVPQPMTPQAPMIGQTAQSVVSAIAAAPEAQPWRGEPQAAQAARAHAPATSTLRIQLQPAELGLVTARLVSNGTQLSIEIQVESNDAWQRLSSESDSIVKALRAVGYEIDRVSVQQQGPQNAQSGTQQQASFGREQGQMQNQSEGGGERRQTGEGGRNGQQSGQNHGMEAAHDRADGDLYI